MLRGVRQQQDELERFSICSRQAAVVHLISHFNIFCAFKFIFYVKNEICFLMNI